MNGAFGTAVPQPQVVVPPTGSAARPPRRHRRRLLELVARHLPSGFVQHAQAVQVDGTVQSCAVVVEVVGVRHAQRCLAGRQRQRPRQQRPRHRSGLRPALATNGQRALGAVLVEIIQRVHAAPLVPVVTRFAVVLERARHRIQDAVANGAGRVAQRRIVAVRERHRVRGAGRGLFHVHAEEVVVGPARPRPVAIGGRGGIALQERLGVQQPHQRVVGGERAGRQHAQAHAGVEARLIARTVVVVARDGGRLELVDVLNVVEDRGRAVDARRRRVGHDVVRGEDLGVGKVVLHNVGDEFQRRPRGAVLHGVVPIPHRASAGFAQADVFAVVVHEEAVVANYREASELPIREQAIIGGPQQELVKGVAGQQPAERVSQGLRVAGGNGGAFGRRGCPAGENQRRATQRGRVWCHAHAIEQRRGGWRCRRPGRTETRQEPRHERVFFGAGGHLRATAVADALDAPQDDVRTVFHPRQKALENQQVACLDARAGADLEHQPGVRGHAASDMAACTPALHDGRDVLAENAGGGGVLRRGKRGQIRHMAALRGKQAHHVQRLCRPNREPPRAGAIAKRANEAIAPGLQLGCREGENSVRADRHPQLAKRRRAAFVNAGNRRLDIGIVPIHHAQPPALPAPVGRCEERDFNGLAGVRRGRIPRHQEAVLGTGVHRDLQVERCVQAQPPRALAAPERAGEALFFVALFQVFRCQMRDGARGELERGGPIGTASVVKGLNPHLAGGFGTIDHVEESARRRGRGREERNRMDCHAVFDSRRDRPRGKVGQPPVRAIEQVHGMNGPVRPKAKLPAKRRPLRLRDAFGGDGACPAGRHSHARFPPSRAATRVDAADDNGGRLGPGIDHP